MQLCKLSNLCEDPNPYFGEGSSVFDETRDLVSGTQYFYFIFCQILKFVHEIPKRGGSLKIIKYKRNCNFSTSSSVNNVLW
jgi:hypothetical protein